MQAQPVELTAEKLRALQLKGLEMLRYFKAFCEEHHLLFYLCGGCCIGALRNGGFIPWDDDVDVFMPREDYEKLKELWPKFADTKRYACLYPNADVVLRHLFLSISDNETTMIKPHQQDLDISHGVVLDVLPLDGCPTGIRRKIQVFWALVYSIYCAQLVPKNHGGAMSLLGRFLLTVVPSKRLRYKIWRMAERHMTKYRIEDCPYITELCSGPHYMKNEYPKEAFLSAVYRPFEGDMMPLPQGYDEYLKMAFGDYMTPPPKEKQSPHHDILFYDLEHSYQQYKGIWYCIGQNEEKKESQSDGKANG